MPKIRGANLADVSADFTPVDPGVYEAEIEKFEEARVSDSPERWKYDVKYKIVGSKDKANADMVGRSVKDQIHLHTKTGEENEIGSGQVRKHFEVTHRTDRWDDKKWENADTDMLIGKRLLVDVTIEGYEVEDKMTGKKEQRKSNRINQIASA